MKNRRKLVLFIAIYMAVLMAFSLYWGYRYQDNAEFARDHFSYCLDMTLFATYFFTVFVSLRKRKFHAAFLIIFPMIVTMISFVLGFGIVTAFGMDDTPKQTIMLYAITNMLTLLYAMFTVVRQPRVRKRKVVPENPPVTDTTI